MKWVFNNCGKSFDEQIFYNSLFCALFFVVVLWIKARVFNWLCDYERKLRSITIELWLLSTNLNYTFLTRVKTRDASHCRSFDWPIVRALWTTLISRFLWFCAEMFFDGLEGCLCVKLMNKYWVHAKTETPPGSCFIYCFSTGETFLGHMSQARQQ